MKKTLAYIPEAPNAIEKGSSLKDLLDQPAIDAMIHNISLVYPSFDGEKFRKLVNHGLTPLTIKERGHHFALALHQCLPENFTEATEILLKSLTPPLTKTSDVGLGVFFYLPHTTYVRLFGLDPVHNGGVDPFPQAMKAQYELTHRFSAEFSIRAFLIRWPERTMEQLMNWTKDENPHVRRLCSEGSRPRLPWAERIPFLVENPAPVIPILETLKDDEELYVRRSVANHLGDIAKDHLGLVLDICEDWLKGASKERKWMIRHALRHPAKKQHPGALEIRQRAK